MRNTSVRAIAALLVLAPAVAAWSVKPIDLEAGSKLWVSGTSTVRSWQCKATSFDASIESQENGAASAAILGGEKVVSKVNVTVQTDKLDCSNGTMNEHMLKALKAKEFASITFALTSYDLVKESDGVKVTMNGTLSLGGVQKPITVLATARAEGAGVLRMSGVQELNMKDYSLKPPSLMLGTMKVNEMVKVNFDLLLKD
jgi:polyisoprenoid-binding protein YceI